MPGLSNVAQLREVLLAVGMGFLLGGYYGLFAVWRRLGHRRVWVVFFQDCFFFISAAVMVFIFALAIADGVIRWYTLVGLTMGLAVERMTMGRVLLGSIGLLRRRFRCFVEQIRKKAKKFSKNP